MAVDPNVAPVGDLEHWRQAYVENFEEDYPLGTFPPASDGWAAYKTGWKDSSGHGTYSPRKVISIKDGILTKHIHTENGVPLVAAISPMLRLGRGQLYGRYAVRWRSDKLPGYKIAWLLWPDSGNRAEGELDWPEMNLDASQIGGFVHHPWVNGVRPPQGWVFVPADVTQWHTTVMEWSPNLVVFYLDGVEVYRTDEGVPSTIMHWVIQTETAMSGAPVPDPAVAGNVQIMWCSLWNYDLTAHAPPGLRQTALRAPATATGVVALEIDASPDISSVKWVLDDVEIGSDNSRPFSRPWDSATVSNGSHRLRTKAKGAYWFETPDRGIIVKNPWDLVCPEVCTGVVTLSVAPQYKWYKMAKWVVDGVEVGSDASPPFGFQWNSAHVDNGLHTIYAKVEGDKWMDGPHHSIMVAN